MSNTNANNGRETTENSPSSIPAIGVLPQPAKSDPFETIFGILKSQHRRYLLYYLYQHGELAVDELAELIAASETGGDPTTVTAAQREKIQIGLVHIHLPKLVWADIVAYDKTTQGIHLREDIPHLKSHLDETAKVDLQEDRV